MEESLESRLDTVKESTEFNAKRILEHQEQQNQKNIEKFEAI